MSGIRLVLLLSYSTAFAQPSSVEVFPYIKDYSGINSPAFVQSERFLYVAGNDRWYYRNAYAALFDVKSGRQLPCPIKTDGAVHDAVREDKGGFYIIGDFKHINGRPRGGLARLDSAFGLDTAWRLDLPARFAPLKEGQRGQWHLSQDEQSGCLLLLQRFVAPNKVLASEEGFLWLYNPKRPESGLRLLRSFEGSVEFVPGSTACLRKHQPRISGSATAPFRDSFFVYSPQGDSLHCPWRLRYFDGYPAPMFQTAQGRLHVVYDQSPTAGTNTDSLVWLCIDLKSGLQDTLRSERLVSALKRSGKDLKDLLFHIGFLPEERGDRLFVCGKGEAETWLVEWRDTEGDWRLRPWGENNQTATIFEAVRTQGYLPASEQAIFDDQGRMLLVGSFEGAFAFRARGLCRFSLPDMQWDSSFTPRINDGIKSLFLHQGRLYACGAFTKINDKPYPGIARLEDADSENASWDHWALGYTDMKLTAVGHDADYWYFMEKSAKDSLHLCRLAWDSDGQLGRMERVRLPSKICNVHKDDKGFWLYANDSDGLRLCRFAAWKQLSALKGAWTLLSKKRLDMYDYVLADSDADYVYTHIRNRGWVARYHKKTNRTDTLLLPARMIQGQFYKGDFYCIPPEGHFYLWKYDFDRPPLCLGIDQASSPSIWLRNVSVLQLVGGRWWLGGDFWNLNGEDLHGNIVWWQPEKSPVYELLTSPEQDRQELLGNDNHPKAVWSASRRELFAEGVFGTIALNQEIISESHDLRKLHRIDLSHLPPGEHKLRLSIPGKQFYTYTFRLP